MGRHGEVGKNYEKMLSGQCCRIIEIEKSKDMGKVEITRGSENFHLKIVPIFFKIIQRARLCTSMRTTKHQFPSL